MRYSQEFTDRYKFLNKGEVQIRITGCAREFAVVHKAYGPRLISQTKLHPDGSRLYLLHSSTVLISIYFM